jgi:GDP-L-fucose synthase
MKLKNKKILIFGSTGMVGKSLLTKLKLNNCKIFYPSSKKINLLNFKKTTAYIKKIRPTIIINLAAYVGGILANTNNPLDFLNTNNMMSSNLINASYKNNIKYFINIACSCIYPLNCKRPIKEEYLLTGRPEPTNEGYALAKINALKLCEYITKSNKKFKYITLIPANIYGPYDNFDDKTGHMIGSIIDKLMNAKKRGKKKINCWGTGKVFRELLYVEDMADSIVHFSELIIKKKINHNIINIGTGQKHLVDNVINILKSKILPQCKIAYDKKKPSGMKSKVMNINLAKKYGWKSKTNLKEGLEKTVQFASKIYT